MNRKSKIKNKSKNKKNGITKNAVSLNKSTLVSRNNSDSITISKPSYLELPTNHIKSDLIGIIIFAIFAFGVIFVLKYYNITLDLVLSYISTTFVSL